MTSESAKQSTAIILSVVLSLMTAAAVYAEFYQPDPTHLETMQASDPDANLSRIKAPNAFFYTNIFLDRDQTFVFIPFRFQNPQQQFPIWLNLRASQGSPYSWLMYHPQLMELSWDSLQAEDLTLYQKNPLYASIDDFLAQPPEQATILTDPAILERQRFPALSAVPLTDTIDLENTDYILTTFKAPSLQDNGFYWYEITIDASQASVDDQGQLAWEIASNASPENQLLLKEIHVDYR